MKIRTVITLLFVTLALSSVSLWMGNISKSWFPPQATAESLLIDNLFSFLVTLGTFIFLGVTGTLTYSILFQRAGKYDMSDGPPIEGNIKLEIVWTAIPFFLVLWIGAYSYQVYDQMGILAPMEHVHGTPHIPISKPYTEVEVLAKQWSWEFRYPGTNVSSTELHLPASQRVRLKLMSADVIHGFYIPAFRLKQDIIPSETIDFEFTPIRVGKYRLRDSQFSGTYFAAMQADVVVETPEDYSNWLSSSAKRVPMPAYNQAYAEYTQLRRGESKGWTTVAPSTPPVVNYYPNMQNGES
jgi:cytochrome c oxidase subunit 2